LTGYYYENHPYYATYTYAINAAKTEVTEYYQNGEEEKYTLLASPKTPDPKSPLAGFWVTGNNPADQSALVISKVMRGGDYFIILYGRGSSSAYTIENGRSKIGGAAATAYRYTLQENPP
jgi:hypothetical protein